MLGEICLIGGAAAIVSFCEQQNLFNTNPGKLWWFDPARWTPPAAAARSTFPTPIRTMTPEEKIRLAQIQMANGQRIIAEATREQMQQSYYIPGQLGKYSLSEQWSQSFPEPVRKPQGVRAL